MGMHLACGKEIWEVTKYIEIYETFFLENLFEILLLEGS